MTTTRFLLLITLFSIGCGKTTSTPHHIQAWVDEWGNMGMYLPDDEQVSFLHANLKDVAPELVAAVNHENPDVRQRAAFVVGKIGPDAKFLGPDLIRRLKQEKIRLVRIYLVDALARINYQDEETVKALRSQFDSLKSDNTPGQLFAEYAEVDEKIKVAAALYDLSNADNRQQYLEFVTQWLKPPDTSLSALEKEGYWERRWMAVNSLENMKGATSVVPLLESMLQENDAKDWVSVHVPRVLAVLRQ
jgi:HEAT repeats